MSGHSKWSKVKHQKETTDAAKGKIFTKLANAIIIAVSEGGGITDPNSNFRLRLAIEKARTLNMPKEKIDRAIERAIGANTGEAMQQVVYEAFGPGGVGMIIEVVTTNKQRTVAEIKNILERGGGTLATTGAVSHLFKYMGLISIEKKDKSFDSLLEIAINSGASDIEDLGDTLNVYTTPSDLHKVKEALVKNGIPVTAFELCYRPLVTVPVDDPQSSANILKLLSNLEEIEDVHKVYANFDIPAYRQEYLK